MYPGASNLPSEVRRNILAQIRSRVGELEYQRLVVEFGEDGLIDQVVAASHPVRKPERRALTLSAKEMRLASMVGGSIFGLALGGLFALGAWLLHAVFGVPNWHSCASLFYAMPLVLCLGILLAGQKLDFRSYLFLLALLGLIGGLIGSCRWGCGWQGSLSEAIMSHGQGLMAFFVLMGLVLWVLSLGKLDGWACAAQLMCVFLGLVAIIAVLVDASQDPAGVSKFLDRFLIPKLIGSTSLFGFLLGSCFSIRGECPA